MLPGFVNNMSIFSCARSKNLFWGSVSMLAKNMNFKFIVLISNLNQ
jgi:hypothetical protein